MTRNSAGKVQKGTRRKHTGKTANNSKRTGQCKKEMQARKKKWRNTNKNSTRQASRIPE